LQYTASFFQLFGNGSWVFENSLNPGASGAFGNFHFCMSGTCLQVRDTHLRFISSSIGWIPLEALVSKQR